MTQAETNNPLNDDLADEYEQVASEIAAEETARAASISNDAEELVRRARAQRLRQAKERIDTYPDLSDKERAAAHQQAEEVEGSTGYVAHPNPAVEQKAQEVLAHHRQPQQPGEAFAEAQRHTRAEIKAQQEQLRGQPQQVQRARPAPLKLDQHGSYITEDQHQEHILACMLMDAGAAPASFTRPVQIMIARQALRSVGLNPYTALRQCGYINGAFTVYGDLELALVRKSGLLEYIREFHYCVNKDGTYARRCFANANLHLPIAGAICQIKRKDQEEYEADYTIERAQAAGLWGRKGPWSTFPHRMLQMRARAEAIRNTFSDVTQGVATQEYDFEGIDR